MPEITDLKAGSVPTEEELLGMVEKVKPGTFFADEVCWCDNTGLAFSVSLPDEWQGVHYEDVPDDVQGRAAQFGDLIIAAVSALPSLIAAKAQAEARAEVLQQDNDIRASALRDAQARADQAEGRVRELEADLEEHRVSVQELAALAVENGLALKAAEAENARTSALIAEACDLLAERKYGSPARSPGHNARLCLESALQQKGGG